MTKFFAMLRFIKLTLVALILAGILLPLTQGVKDSAIIAVTLCSVWFIYASIFFVSTFISGRRNLKKRLKEDITDRWGFS